MVVYNVQRSKNIERIFEKSSIKTCDGKKIWMLGGPKTLTLETSNFLWALNT